MDDRTIDYSKLSQERILNIRELVFECIRKWWIVVIFAVVFAGLLGGYKYQKDLKNAKAGGSDKEESEAVDVEAVRESLSEDELMAANYVIHLKKTVAELNAYLEGSLLMQMNLYDENVAVLQYYIDNDYKADYSGITEKDYSTDLREAYQVYIANGGLAADLQEAVLQDVEQLYVNELIKWEQDSENSFTLEITGRDEAECKRLAEQAESLIDEYQGIVKNQIGEHHLKLVESAYTRIVDENSLNQRNSKQNIIQDFQNKIEANTESLNSDQKKYVEAMSASQEENTTEEGEKQTEAHTPVVHISKKYVAVGGIGGILAAALLIIFVYLMRGTVNAAEDIQYLYNIKILGKLGKAKWFSGMNKDEKKQLQLLFVNIKTLMDMKQVRRVYVSGSVLEKLNPERLEQLRQQAKDLKLELEFGENFLYQPESLERMLACDAVILLEKEHTSKYMDIVNEYRICAEYRKELLGMVMFV